MNIHFYYAGTVPIELIDAWDPEQDPMRFPDGEGHAFFQLYLSLRNQGSNVTLGGHIPRQTQALVIYKKSKLNFIQQLHLLITLLFAKHFILIVQIASDCKSNRTSSFAYHAEIVPNIFCEVENYETFIPLLPQNGLVPRPYSQWNGNIGIYCNRKNYPTHLLTDTFLTELKKYNIKLKTVFLGETGQEEICNYSDISMLLCIRNRNNSEIGRKPPTKLVNAWCGGVLPIIDREAGYLSIGIPGKDCILLETDHIRYPEKARLELLHVLAQYQSARIASPLLSRIAVRTREFSKENITREYQSYFTELLLCRPSALWQEKLFLILSFASYLDFGLQDRIHRVLKRYRRHLFREMPASQYNSAQS